MALYLQEQEKILKQEEDDLRLAKRIMQEEKQKAEQLRSNNN